jgi:hypothetical protein
VEAGVKLGRAPETRWCLVGLSKTQRRRLKKMYKSEMDREREERAHVEWFNKAWPMIMLKQMWREKQLAQEEGNDSEETDQSSASGRRDVEVNMVFELPAKFRVPEKEVAELMLGAEAAVFQKPEKTRTHMKPLFIKGYLQGHPIQHVMVNGGAGVNVMPLATFEKMVYRQNELMRANTSLSAFTVEVTSTKGVMSVELTVSGKTIAMTFFIVDVSGR